MTKLDANTVVEMLAHYRALQAWSDEIRQGLEENSITPTMLLDAMARHEAEADPETRDSLAYLSLAGGNFQQLLQDRTLSPKIALDIIARYYAANPKRMAEITPQTRQHLIILARNGASMAEIIRLALQHDDISWLVPIIKERMDSPNLSLPRILKIMSQHDRKPYPAGATALLPVFTQNKADPAQLLKLALKLESVRNVDAYIQGAVLDGRTEPTELIRACWHENCENQKDLLGFLIEQGASLKTVFSFLITNHVEADVLPAIRKRLDQEPDSVDGLLSLMEDMKKRHDFPAYGDMPGKLLAILVFCGADVPRAIDVAMDTKWMKTTLMEKLLEQSLPSRLRRDKSLPDAILRHLDLQNEKLPEKARLLLPLIAEHGADMAATLKLAMRNEYLEYMHKVTIDRLQYGKTAPDALLDFWRTHESSYPYSYAVKIFFDDLLPKLAQYGADMAQILPLALREDMTCRQPNRKNRLEQILPHIESRLKAKTANPSLLLDIVDQHERQRLRKTPETDKPKMQDELINLLAAHGADFSTCTCLPRPWSLVAKGQMPATGICLTSHVERCMYVFSSKRPTIAEPVIEPRSTCVYRNQTQDIAQANRYEAELKNFVTLHKLPAFAAILAENAGQLETLASECDPALPELMPEIRKFQSFWQSRKIRMPENSYHTCQAAKHAGPELLHTLLTALPKHEERMEAVRCLAPYMSIMEEILRAKAQTQANKAIILRTKTDQACKTTTRQLEPFRQRLKEIPGTIIGHETLTALEKLAETHGAQAAINTLNTQPQSFDVHFVKTWQVGDLSVNLRPWNWIRTRFHADAWYPRLVDYRKDLARWQEQDPDKSFALLKHILEQKEEMGKTISPLNAQAMIAEEAHKVFESLSQEARRLVPQLMKIQFSLAEQPSTNHRRYTPILTPTQKPPG